MKILKHLMSVCFAVLMLGLLNSCKENNDSVFYKVDPNAVPQITDTVKAKERVITGRLSYFNASTLYRTNWNLGKGSIYAIMDTVPITGTIPRDFDISSVYVLAEADFDEYGQFSLTLPDYLPPEYVDYAENIFEDFDVESKQLLTNKYQLHFIVKYEHSDWGSVSDNYEYMFINRDEERYSFHKDYNYTYHFFTEKSSITGKNEEGKTCNIYTEKGWTILEEYKNNTDWCVHLPADVYHFIFAL